VTILYDDRGLVVDKTESFLKKYENIGCICSGGTDSSFLLWWLAKCIDDLNLHNSHILLPVHAVDLGFPFNTKFHFLKILEFIRDSYPKINILDPYIIKYKKDFDSPIIIKKNKYIKPIVDKLEKGLIDTSISGMTSAPLFDKINLGSITKERNYNENDMQEKRSLFIHVDKKFLAFQYKKFDLMNNLFPLTKSCVTPDAKGNPCKKCMWCKEKYWAFNCYDGGIK